MTIDEIEVLIREKCRGKRILCGTFSECPIGHLTEYVRRTGVTESSGGGWPWREFMDPVAQAMKILNVTRDNVWAFVWGFDGKSICQSTADEPFRDLGFKLRREWLPMSTREIV